MNRFLHFLYADDCAICKNHLMDLCIESRANQASATNEGCTVVWGRYGWLIYEDLNGIALKVRDSFHTSFHLISLWYVGNQIRMNAKFIEFLAIPNLSFRYQEANYELVLTFLYADIVVDNCAICRNHIVVLCNECQANQVSAKNEECKVAWDNYKSGLAFSYVDIVVDNCVICKNHIVDLCKEI